jgi:hypothetical protein
MGRRDDGRAAVKEFGEQVEIAAATVWRLMLWDVPDNLGGLTARLGFRQTRKNPRNWWRTFNSVSDRELAESIRRELRDAGLRGSWGKVALKPPAPSKPKYAAPPAKWRPSSQPAVTARPRYGARGHRRSSGW